jgi:hypothetical protein
VTDLDRDIETRLRDAFAARADLVRPESLRREPPPPPAVRHLRRWVVPGVTGLAVAAAATGVLVVTAPAQYAAQPVRPAQSASPAPSPTPSPARSGPRPTPAPSGTPTDVKVRPTPAPQAVPPLAQVVTASGWTVRVPSTWAARPYGVSSGATATCVGTDEQPCLLRLAAGLDAAAPPDPGVLGGTVLPGLASSTCRRAGDGTRLDVGDGAATLATWACGAQTYQQATLPARMLLAVAWTGPDTAGQTALAVVRTLRRDASHVREYVVRSCPDVPFTANSEDVAGDVRAGGVTCAAARDLVTDLHAVIGAVSGPSKVTRKGWVCTVQRSDDVLPTAAVTCRGTGGETVTYRQT